MSRLRPSTDVLPITEFRATTSTMLSRLHAAKRPVILTQHGRGAAVGMDVSVEPYRVICHRDESELVILFGAARAPRSGY
jgi:PHD/YefM family antitoxin component YafN of YafNO toxin-antitoxin module